VIGQDAVDDVRVAGFGQAGGDVLQGMPTERRRAMSRAWGSRSAPYQR
jgi:hypothetical protein